MQSEFSGKRERTQPANSGNLVDRLMEAGLLQFGLFGKDEAPFRLSYHLLPAYPDVLKQIADEAQAYIADMSIDRLVCASSALPFGLTVSLCTGIPLVYSLGSDFPGVHDLVGAYDVGHPAWLLANTWSADMEVSPLVDKARKVGLEIDTVLAIMDCGRPSQDGICIVSVLRMADVVTQLAETDALPLGQARAVQDWLDKPMAGNIR